VARIAQHVVERRRAAGERVGLVKVKLFRPFLREEFQEAIGAARRVGVLDRNHSPGSGGIFWSEIATSVRGRSDLLLQDYIVGLGGVDVDMALLEGVLDDLGSRPEAAAPVFVHGGSQ
jgi:pyruvate/2-oxoacid:ferredoxin oxidoreductase alpha subunit